MFGSRVMSSLCASTSSSLIYANKPADHPGLESQDFRSQSRLFFTGELQGFASFKHSSSCSRVRNLLTNSAHSNASISSPLVRPASKTFNVPRRLSSLLYPRNLSAVSCSSTSSALGPKYTIAGKLIIQLSISCANSKLSVSTLQLSYVNCLVFILCAPTELDGIVLPVG